jgi:hypothetical protein
MKLDPGMHIVMHFVFFGKTGVTGGAVSSVQQHAEVGGRMTMVGRGRCYCWAVIRLVMGYSCISKKNLPEGI